MPTTRDAVFDRIVVDHLVRGGTRVSWGLFYQFTYYDPGPFTFQLQHAPHGLPAADDWIDVGGPLVNTWTTIDPDRHLKGTNPVTHYRVVLTTPLGTYASGAASVYGILLKHDWLIAHELVRKELLRHGKWAGENGVLIKRRRTGQPQAPADAADPRKMITDPLTGEIIRRVGPAAVPSQGARFVPGYYKPVPFWIDFDTGGLFEQVDPEQRGNVDDDTTAHAGRAILFPPPAARDLFFAAGSDLRYEVNKIKVLARVRGVPMIGQVELRQIAYSDILYTLDPATL